MAYELRARNGWNSKQQAFRFASRSELVLLKHHPKSTKSPVNRAFFISIQFYFLTIRS